MTSALHALIALAAALPVGGETTIEVRMQAIYDKETNKAARPLPGPDAHPHTPTGHRAFDATPHGRKGAKRFGTI